MDDQIKLNDIADDLLILNKQTIDTLFRLDNCADCVALYMFYYKTAKWQKTNTIKAVDQYVKKSLKWGIDRVKRTKETLKENGLISIVQRRQDGKISGWYVEVSYLVSDNKLEDVRVKVEDSKNTQNQQVENSTCGFQETNALKEYNKCLKTNNINTINDSVIKEEFERVWKQYPRKEGKEAAFKEYSKLRSKLDYDTFNEFTVLSGIKRYKDYISLNKIESRYVKQGSTWFHGHCWEDEYPIDRFSRDQSKYCKNDLGELPF